jgi:hypothetical protein
MATIEELQNTWGRPWKALLIDERYVVEDGYELRYAISFGPNETITIGGGVLAPPVLPGIRVFGVHLVLIEDEREINLVDQWFDAFPVDDATSDSEVRDSARSLLAAWEDEDYRQACCSKRDSTNPLLRRPIGLSDLVVSNRHG